MIISESQRNKGESLYSFFTFEDDDACLSFSKRIYGDRLKAIYHIRKGQTVGEALRNKQKVEIYK